MKKNCAIMPTLNVMEKIVSVVVADDHKLIREKVVQLIDSNCEVIGTVADGNAALEMIQLLKPEIAILDISMPFLTGIEVAVELKKCGSNAKVIILTAHEDYEYASAALSAGAMGYVVKFHMGADLIPALNMVKTGGKFLSPCCEMTG